MFYHQFPVSHFSSFNNGKYEFSKLSRSMSIFTIPSVTDGDPTDCKSFWYKQSNTTNEFCNICETEFPTWVYTSRVPLVFDPVQFLATWALATTLDWNSIFTRQRLWWYWWRNVKDKYNDTIHTVKASTWTDCQICGLLFLKHQWPFNHPPKYLLHKTWINALIFILPAPGTSQCSS